MNAFFRRLSRFFSELKRRKVYQVTAVYVVLAVGSLEVLDLLVPATRLPEWASPLLLSLAVVGLPLVVVFAWTFDITPGGLVKTPDLEDGPRSDERRRPDPDPSGPVEESPEPPLDPLVVAVLPFDNLTGQDDAEPFAVGLHDDLLTELSRASALTVISRTSVRGYRDTDKSMRRIGKELGAGTIVEGGVQMAGQRVRLNVQLIDARTDAHLWAERYDRALSTETIFDLQSELVSQIMRALEARLTPEEQARPHAQATEDLTAYRLYVRGRTQIEQWGEPSLQRAVAYFQQAIERDPDYALAWAGLADAVSLLSWYRYEVPHGAPPPEQAARRALELDPDLAEAYASQAIVLCSRGHQDAPGALAALERAIRLRPSYAHAHIWLAWVNLLVGRPVDAIAPAERAAALDPMAPAARVFLAETYLCNDRGDEALAEAVHGRELQPDHAFSHYIEALVLHHLGRGREADAAAARTLALLGPNAVAPTRLQTRALLAVIRTTAGETEAGREFLASPDADEDPYSAGLVHASLGDHSRALECFEAVANWGQLSIEGLRYLFPTVLGPLRENPGYDRLLRRADESWKVA